MEERRIDPGSSVALVEAWRMVYLSLDMTSFFCAYLGVEVQLSGEREAHIAERHPICSPNIESGLAPP